MWIQPVHWRIGVPPYPSKHEGCFMEEDEDMELGRD